MYTRFVYTMVADIFEHTVLCQSCQIPLVPESVVQEGFLLRSLQCHSCDYVLYHPDDVRDFEDYKKLRQQRFQVKLRFVGNSFCVSIPKEIVSFIRESQRAVENDFSHSVKLSLEEPGKVSLFFVKRNVYHVPLEEDER